jgi:hypothetical protein
MEKMNRRNFCGASLLALPLMNVFAEDKGIDGFSSESDPVMNALADEFTRTTLDGAHNGFGSTHFRQYAGLVRIFNAHLDAKGTNRRLNKKLDDDDYYLLNPERTVRITMEYWKKRGVILNEDTLTSMAVIDGNSYGSIKKAIKKQGGIEKLHESIAEAFDRMAEEHETTAFRSGLTFHNGSIIFPAVRGGSRRNHFLNVQDVNPGDLDPHMFIGIDLDCLCKAMKVEGALLSILCVTVCPPCCVPAALMLALATLGESMGFCDSKKC